MRPILFSCLALALPLVAAAGTPRRSAGPINRFERIAPAALSPLRTPVVPVAPRTAATADNTDGEVLFEMHPTEEEFGRCTVLDANGDGRTITYHVVVTATSYFDWPIYYDRGIPAVAADEWLFTPAITFNDETCLYNLSIDARASATNIPEAFELMVGTAPSPEAMTVKVIDEPAFYPTDYQRLDANFHVPSPGEYYVGIHVKSNEKAFRVMMRDLRVAATSVSSDVPAAPTDIEAVSGHSADGYVADVTFTMPELTVNGNTLDAGTDITVTAYSDIASASVTGHPGTRQSLTVACGSTTGSILLVSSNSLGEGGSASALLIPGSDIPVDPVVTYTVSDDNMSMILKWDHVTQGANGGTVKADELTYNIYAYLDVTDSDGNVIGAAYQPVVTGIKSNSYTVTVPPGTLQSTVDVIVTAQTSAGESDGNILSSAIESLGELYPLPMDEDLRTLTVKYSGYNVNTMDMSYSDATTGFSRVSGLIEEAGSGGAFCIITYSQSAKCMANFPRFDFTGAHHMAAMMSVWISDITGSIDVYINGSDGSREKIGEVRPDASASEWRELTFNIPEKFNGLPWAYLSLDGNLPSPYHLFMAQRIVMRSCESHDVAVGQVPEVTVTLGQTHDLSAEISNAGYDDVDAPRVMAHIMDGTNEMTAFELTTTVARIPSTARATYSGKLTIGKADFCDRNLTLVIEALDDADTNPDNNVASARLVVRRTTAPVVNDLSGAANATGDGVVLTWTNPVSPIITEDFELYEHGDHSSAIGPWTNLDFDGRNVYTVSDTPFPDEVSPKAFQVINHTYIDSEYFRAFDGTNFLIAFSAQEARSDDWLISPVIDPSAGLSFELSAISSDFTEVLEVCVSTTDNELDSFTPVRTIESNLTQWLHYDIQLPDNARYVAFHYASYDQYGIMIDNIVYKSPEYAYELVGFNVYCNDVKLNATPLIATTFEHLDAGFASNRYNVSVVARLNGQESEHPLSNTVIPSPASTSHITAGNGVVVSAVGGIVLTGYNVGMPVGVYDASGRMVATSVTTTGNSAIGLPAGLYLVKVGQLTSKVIVR